MRRPSKKNLIATRELAYDYRAAISALRQALPGGEHRVGDACDSMLNAMMELDDAISFLNDAINGDWLGNNRSEKAAQ